MWVVTIDPFLAYLRQDTSGTGNPEWSTNDLLGAVHAQADKGHRVQRLGHDVLQ